MPPRWLPNAISVMRIALIPVCVVLAARAQQTAPPDRAAPLAVYLTLGATDLLDGWLARRFALATNIGALMDALADKLAQISLLAFFTFSDGTAYAPVPLWFFLLAVGRDLVLAAGGLTVKRRTGNVDMSHHLHGRLCSVLVFALIAALLAGLPQDALHPVLYGLSVLMLLSAAAYVREGFRQVRAHEAR